MWTWIHYRGRMVVKVSFQQSDSVKWIIALAPFVEEEMTFGKRTVRGKTLLQDAAYGRNQNRLPGIF
jgi:hypothetical protein